MRVLDETIVSDDKLKHSFRHFFIILYIIIVCARSIECMHFKGHPHLKITFNDHAYKSYIRLQFDDRARINYNFAYR